MIAWLPETIFVSHIEGPGRGYPPIKVTGHSLENFENTPKRYQNLVLWACSKFISTPKRYQFNNNKSHNCHCKF